MNHKGVLPTKCLESAAAVTHKPDTDSRKMKNVTRYVTSQDPTRKASLSVKKP